ncbi:MAG TPA: lysophospholipid acyltransferase family protein [Lachnospiraceae bacterium]|nr:lysophospholipid acyltransferase family protein [Lachnospiraceae bacterium]
MRRILVMAFHLFLKTPYYWFQIWWCSIHKSISYEKGYQVIRHITQKANRAGRVTIETHGLENIPKENGFMLYPNHQGLYDVLSFLDSCPVPFAFVIKKEVSNLILIKQIIGAIGSEVIDRDDIKQSMQVINKVAKEVENGRNYLIFAEGTRSKNGNNLLEFKGGSFKCATKSKCPIVPCALIDSFKPFDEKSIKPITVKLIYLPPLYYDEYKNMKTNEIAEQVKSRIEAVIREYTS